MPKVSKDSVIVMDNASFHKREDILNCIKSAGCIAEFLPSYSPDLNPIEHSWAKIKSIRKKQRRILTQLNRGEERHNVAHTIFHGRRGEMRKSYREGQEDQLGSLGLVLNTVVLWNTIYMESALDHLKNQSATINDYHRCFMNISMCLDIIHLRFQNKLKKENLDR